MAEEEQFQGVSHQGVDGCDFSGQTMANANFRGDLFEEHANFANCVFTGGADFGNAVFRKGATFDGARFGAEDGDGNLEHVTFANCRFGSFDLDALRALPAEKITETINLIREEDRADLRGLFDPDLAPSAGRARLVSIFCNLLFRTVTPGEYYSLLEKSKRHVSFDSVRFENNGKVDFSYTKFENAGPVSFRSARFQNAGRVYFDFAYIQNRGPVDFGSTLFENSGAVSFFRSRFQNVGPVDFGSAQFLNSGVINFEFVRFFNSGCVNFYDLTLMPGGPVTFDNIVWLNSDSVLDDTEAEPESSPGDLIFTVRNIRPGLDFRFAGCLFLNEGLLRLNNLNISEIDGRLFHACHFRLGKDGGKMKVDFINAMEEIATVDRGEIEWVKALARGRPSVTIADIVNERKYLPPAKTEAWIARLNSFADDGFYQIPVCP